MEKKDYFVVKRLADASEFEKMEHCSFWALDRAVSKEAKLSSLETKEAVQAAFRQKLTVVAVSDIEILIPFAVADARCGERYYVAGGYLTIKIAPRGNFYDWVLREILVNQKATLGERDLCREIYDRYGLGNFFNSLVNTENLPSLMKSGKGATEFQDFPTYLPKWCDFVEINSFCIVERTAAIIPATITAALKTVEEITRPAETLGAALKTEVAKAGRNWLRDMLARPLRSLAVLAGIVVLLYAGGQIIGCVSRGSAQARAEAAAARAKAAEAAAQARAAAEARARATRPVPGTIRVQTGDGERGAARKLLERDGAEIVRAAIRTAGAQSRWNADGSVQLTENQWAAVTDRLRADAAASMGDFDFSGDGHDVVLVAHPGNVPVCELDVTGLRGCEAFVSAVEKAFGVSFDGRAVVSAPVRAAAQAAACDALKAGGKVQLASRDGGRFVFAPNLTALSPVPGLSYDEIVRKADAFWTEAVATLDTFPKAHAELKARFAPLAQACTAQFAERADRLKDLLGDVSARLDAGWQFIAECGRPWLQFSLKKPADVGARLRAARAALDGLEALKASASARLDRVAFERDVEAFAEAGKNPLAFGGKMIACYNAQQARLQQLLRLRQDVARAKETRDFSQIASFRTRLAAAEQAQRSARDYEMQVGEYVASVCQQAYFDQTFGKAWVRQMTKTYGAKIAEAAAVAARRSADYSGEIVRLYQGATLEKALRKGAGLATAVRDNHVAETGAEAAALSEARRALHVLERVARKNGVSAV